MLADFQRDDRLRVDQLFQFTHTLFRDQHQAHGLDTTGGGAHAATHEGEHDEHDRQERRPASEVLRGKACGGGDGNGLEQAVHQAFAERQGIGQDEVAAGDRDADQQHAEEEAGLGVLPVAGEAAATPGEEVQAEIHRGNHHEQAADQQDRVALEIAHTGVVRGKTANGHG